MQRRFLFGLPLALLPVAGLAQPAPPPGAAPYAPPPSAGGQRPKITELSFEQLTPKQQRRVAKRMGAAQGGPPVPPDQAQRAWDGMDPRQRRQAMRDPNRQANRQRQPPPPQ